MSATVVAAIALGAAELLGDEDQVVVPASHLRRLLAIESAARMAVTYQRPSGAISPSRAKGLRQALES